MSGILLSPHGGTNLGKEAIFAASTNIQDWLVPAGVETFSAVAVGGGGGSKGGSFGGGGGGGALAWANSIAVTPGETLKVYSGLGGVAGSGDGVTLPSSGFASLMYRQNPADHPYEHVQLALRAAGSELDSSMDRKFVTMVAGDPAVNITTADSKFNGKSFAFPASTTGYIKIDHFRRSNMTAADFTISLWIKPTAIGTGVEASRKFLIVRQKTAITGVGFNLGVTPNNALTFRFQNGGVVTSAANLITANEWQHIVVVRDGGTIRLFRNGVQVASGAIAGSMFFYVDEPIIVGKASASATINIFQGFMDDIVIVCGTALWTSAFSVPTAPIETGTAFVSAGPGNALGWSRGQHGGRFSYGGGGGSGGAGGALTIQFHCGGGGGAGGYTGNGGAGASPLDTSTFGYANGFAGTGGGGGGGATFWNIDGNFEAAGGGVGLKGIGTNGAGGIYAETGGGYKYVTGGGGGSGGTSQVVSPAGLGVGSLTTSIAPGVYGGGGGGSRYFSNVGGAGAVRVIWGTNRTFPSSAY